MLCCYRKIAPVYFDPFSTRLPTLPLMLQVVDITEQLQANLAEEHKLLQVHSPLCPDVL